MYEYKWRSEDIRVSDVNAIYIKMLFDQNFWNYRLFQRGTVLLLQTKNTINKFII